jgi:hypothetical protein
LSERLRIKEICRSDHSSIKNRTLPLEMPTLEMAHVGREGERTHLQNNIKAMPEQLKLRKTVSSTWS